MWEKAAQTYSRALEVFEELNYERGILDTKTGLARVALMMEDMEEASGYIDSIIAYMDGEIGFGPNRSPLESYLVCVHVLQATGDPRKREVLEKACAEMQKIANKIKDEDRRHSFLENVPWNRELVQLWEEQHKK
jgi:hypothetical protein